MRSFGCDPFTKSILGMISKGEARRSIHHRIRFCSLRPCVHTVPEVRDIGMSGQKNVTRNGSEKRKTLLEVLDCTWVLAAPRELESICGHRRKTISKDKVEAFSAF